MMNKLCRIRLAGGATVLAALCLQGCSDYEPVEIPDAVVQLAFEGNLDNLGSAAMSGEALDGKLEFRNSKTGKALFAVGDGRWVEVNPQDKLRLGDTVEISFDIRRADWSNPYKKSARTQTAVVVSGRGDDGFDHIAFNIDPHSRSLRIGFDDSHDEWVWLKAQHGNVSTGWHNVRLKIDRGNGTTQLFLDDTLVASAQSVPRALDTGITRIKFGTWHRKNQAFRGHIDNFLIRGQSG